MRLYHVTKGKRDVLARCTNVVCRFSGRTEEHISFASQPLAGQGGWVASIDVPAQDVEEYEFDNLFRPEEVKSYALPPKLVDNLPKRWSRFEDITGRPWNEWRISVSDREAGASSGNAWALVWASRPGIVSAELAEQERSEHEEHVEVALHADVVDFDPEADYLIVERHWTVPTPGGPKDKWRLNLMAGVMPNWAVFPWAWSRWVYDDDVRKSALDFIVSLAPTVEGDIKYALSQETKANTARAWRIVADKVGRALGRQLGPLQGESWTKVNAMPLTIASRVGGWMPIKPRPEFEHPDESGRVLIASPEGAFPTRKYTFEESTRPRPINSGT